MSNELRVKMNGRALVAWNLRSLRTGQGYTQDRLAHDAEVDRKFIQRLEQQRGNPTLKMIERLANALNVGLQELFMPPLEGSTPPKPLRCGRKRISS